MLDNQIEWLGQPTWSRYYNPDSGQMEPVDGLVAAYPAECQGKIDRTEILKDGRLVAIAKSEHEDKEAKLKVLQYDETKQEWVKYEPVIKYVNPPYQKMDSLPNKCF